LYIMNDLSQQIDAWKKKNCDLIEEACTNRAAFKSMLRSIYRLADDLFKEKDSDNSLKNEFKSDLYKEISEQWNNDNLFDAVLLKNGKFAIYQVELL